MNIYEKFYIGSLIIGLVVYFYFFYNKHYYSKKIIEDNMSSEEIFRLILINAFIIIPLVSYFYFKDYNYEIPDNIKNIGFFIMIFALFCAIQTSYDLGDNYSYTLQIRENHELVETGIYKYIRHPMYFCGLLFIIGQSLLMPNKIGIITNLIVIYIFATGRIPDEENMLIKKFGNQYIEYMKKTKSVIPYIL